MEHEDQEFDFLSVAVELQGPEAARPYAESTAASFTTLVDAENQLGDALGFKAIPNGILISPQGRLDARVAGGFDVRKPEIKAMVEGWLATDDVRVTADEAEREWSDEALRLFREAGAALRRGERGQAIVLLRQAYPLEPDNLVIRKQLWAIEHPERFYRGEVDYEWQREQFKAGR